MEHTPVLFHRSSPVIIDSLIVWAHLADICIAGGRLGVHCPEHSLSIEVVRFSKDSNVSECFVGSRFYCSYFKLGFGIHKIKFPYIIINNHRTIVDHSEFKSCVIVYAWLDAFLADQ